ncbi:MAG: M20/M25/M40 family metallo-hydrolase [Elusimicrobia bacterium]|nr:M20/M25/M40 family metallo-hydrolase [Elusimicrobiota bacterium]
MNNLFLLCVFCLFCSLSVQAQTKKPASTPLEESIRYLQGYIRIDTTNPPGNEEKSARYLKEILDREGISSAVYVSTSGRANLLAKLPTRARHPEPPLLLLHHMDVVPVHPEEWMVDPFEGADINGFLWGRGALDTKTTGILHLMTLLRLKREGLPLNRDVFLLAVADEEEGGHWGARWMVENRWEDMKPGFVIDEGGFGFRGVFTYQDQTVYACAVEEKKVLALKVTATGKSGHGSVPYDDNPNDILRRALTRIEQSFIRRSGQPPFVVRDMERRLPKMRPAPLTYAIRNNTVAVTSFLSWSGDIENPKTNVIPFQAAATLDCRLLPAEDEMDLVDKLRRDVDDKRVAIEILKRTQNTVTGVDYQTALFDALERAVRANDPEAIVVPFLMPGATDSRYFRSKGAQCYGLAPIVLAEEEFALIHSANERLPLSRLEKGLQIMYDWIKDFVRN